MVQNKVIVTGGSGFIGSHLIDRLIAGGSKVYNLSLISEFERKHNLNDKCINIDIDLLDRVKTDKIISGIRPDIVFHLAANAAEGKSHFSPIDITQRNMGIFMNVIVPSIKAGMRRFVFTSSVAVYGSIIVPFKESDTPNPQDIYGISKLACEKSLRILADVHGFQYVIVRPHNVYGERQNMTDPYRNVVTLFMNSLLKKKPYYIYGNGSMRRCFSYIDDVAQAIVKCGYWDVAGMTFNIGSEKSYTIKELSDLVQKVSGVKVKPKYLPTRVHEVQFAEPDHTLAKKVLGYHETSFEEGLRKTWSWCKSVGYQEPVFTEVELPSEKLPKNWKV